jgi:hypothetical protein
MTTPATPRVVWVGPSDHELIEGAIALRDQNSKTLGFMPHEVYKQAAAAGTLIAVVTDGKVIAYALYSLPRHSVKLKHLRPGGRPRGRGGGRPGLPGQGHESGNLRAEMTALSALAPATAPETRPGLAGQRGGPRHQRPVRSGRAPRRPGPGRPVRGPSPDRRRRARRRRPARARRPVLDRPGPRHLRHPPGRPAAVGRHRAPPALRRLPAPGLLAPPHPRRPGTVHPGRRMAPHLQRQPPRPRPSPGVLRPVATGHHAPHHRHNRDVHAAMRVAPRPWRLGCSSPVPPIAASQHRG